MHKCIKDCLIRWDRSPRTIWGLDPQGKLAKYLTRYHLVRFLGFQIFVHNIHLSDSDRDLHTHPHTGLFILILSGGYWEHRLSGTYRRRPGQIAILGRSKCHLVELSKGRESWSLVLTTPKWAHSWFFLVGKKLIPWISYYRLHKYPIDHI